MPPVFYMPEVGFHLPADGTRLRHLPENPLRFASRNRRKIPEANISRRYKGPSPLLETGSERCGRHTTRKPTLLLRLSGLFLLRLAERRLSGLLFQDPPRKTRCAVKPGDPTNRVRIRNNRPFFKFWALCAQRPLMRPIQ